MTGSLSFRASAAPAGGLGVLEETSEEVCETTPWLTVIYNDPVNLFSYVTACCMRILKCSRETAELYTNQVHFEGRSVVYSGSKEQAELYAQAFSAAHLWCRAERAS